MQGESDEGPNETVSDATTAAVESMATSSTAPEEKAAPPASTTTFPPRATVQGATHAPRVSRSLMENRLWIILGELALSSLLLALAAAASGNGAQGGSLSTERQETVNLIQKVNPSVVQIQARSVARGGIGSGEIATTSGYIVTNSHVVSGFRDLTVLLSDGRTVPAILIGDVPEEDLAVLKISADQLKSIAFGDSNTVQVGDFALALGSPLGLEQSATTGILSALNRTGRVITNRPACDADGTLTER